MVREGKGREGVEKYQDTCTTTLIQYRCGEGREGKGREGVEKYQDTCTTTLIFPLDLLLSI